uniref:Neogenin_C domain-containing protein n=1 Tax=Mesocestoides corti TaxID=53468 RepID=A0A5K3F285_MESCO
EKILAKPSSTSAPPKLACLLHRDDNFTSPAKMAVSMYYPVNRRQSIHRIPAYLPTEPPQKPASPGESSRTLSGDSKSTSSGYVTPRIVHMEGLGRKRPPPPPAPPPSSFHFTRHQDGMSPYLRKNNSNAGHDASVEAVVHAGKKRSFSALKRQHQDRFYYGPRERSIPSSRSHTELYPPLSPWRFEGQRRGSYGHECPPMLYAHRGQYRSSNFNNNNRGSRTSAYFPSTSSTASWKGGFEPSPIPLPQPPFPSKWKSETNLRVSNLDEEAAQIYNEILDAIKIYDSADQNTSVAESRSQLSQDRQWHSLQEKPSSFDDSNETESLTEFTEKTTPMPSLKLLDRRKPRTTEVERHHSDRIVTDLTANLRGLDLSSRALCNRSNSLSASIHPSSYHLDGGFVDNAEETALAALDDAINVDFTRFSAVAGPATKGPTQIIRSYLGEAETDLKKPQERQRNGVASPTTLSVIEIEEGEARDEVGTATDCSDNEDDLFHFDVEPGAVLRRLPHAPDGDIPGQSKRWLDGVHIKSSSPADISDSSDIDL